MQAMHELAKGSQITDLTEMLAKQLEKVVVITDATNRILAHYDPLDTGIEMSKFFTLKYHATKNKQYCDGQWETELGLIDYVYFPIKVEGKSYGNCIVLCSSEEMAIEQLKLIEQMSLVYLLALREILQNDAARERVSDEIVYDILYNNYDSKVALYEKAKHLHWDMEGPYAILVVETKEDKINTVRKAGPLKFNSSSPIHTIVNEKVVFILSLTNIISKNIEDTIDGFVKKLLSNLASNHIKDVHIGISSTAKALTDLHQCFQEAKIALELGKVFNLGKINHFEKMGFLKFVFTASAQELQEFEERILGNIIVHDLELEADLLDTLKVYIEQNCHIANTAKAKYIHENTLRNRLKKIEQLVNLDLSRIDHLVNIYIALQILALDFYDGS
jgi:sugar diacid utilization regulator